MPQLRGTLTRFVSEVIPDGRGIIRTRPLEALIIGDYVRGLSDRYIGDLAREAGLGQMSRSSVSRLCCELRDRYHAFRACSLGDVRLTALFCDAICRCGPTVRARGCWANSEPTAPAPSTATSGAQGADDRVWLPRLREAWTVPPSLTSCESQPMQRCYRLWAQKPSLVIATIWGRTAEEALSRLSLLTAAHEDAPTFDAIDEVPRQRHHRQVTAHRAAGDSSALNCQPAAADPAGHFSRPAPIAVQTDVIAYRANA
jgi:hypothetical protein